MNYKDSSIEIIKQVLLDFGDIYSYTGCQVSMESYDEIISKHEVNILKHKRKYLVHRENNNCLNLYLRVTMGVISINQIPS